MGELARAIFRGFMRGFKIGIGFDGLTVGERAKYARLRKQGRDRRA